MVLCRLSLVAHIIMFRFVNIQYTGFGLWVDHSQEQTLSSSWSLGGTLGGLAPAENDDDGSVGGAFGYLSACGGSGNSGGAERLSTLHQALVAEASSMLARSCSRAAWNRCINKTQRWLGVHFTVRRPKLSIRRPIFKAQKCI